MGTRRDFGDDAAEGGVFFDLRENGVGEDFACAIGRTADHSGGGFVAACLDTEKGQGPVLRHVWSCIGGHGRVWGFAPAPHGL